VGFVPAEAEVKRKGTTIKLQVVQFTSNTLNMTTGNNCKSLEGSPVKLVIAIRGVTRHEKPAQASASQRRPATIFVNCRPTGRRI
jgi:hypothetical protein